MPHQDTGVYRDAGKKMKDNERKINIFRKFVHSPFSYRLLVPFTGLSNLREENPAYKIWVRYLLYMARKAYAHKNPVVWTSSFFPVEAIYGIGLVPYLPEITASLVTYMGWGKRPIALSDSEISTDVCSFYRCVLGLAKEDFLPRPDLIISSSHLCDGANKFFHHLSQIYGCPHLMMDPPYNECNRARRYTAEQLKGVMEKACKILNISLDERMLSRALAFSNQARAYMEKIIELRKSVPSPFPGSEGLSYYAGMSFCTLGSQWGIDFYRTLYYHLKVKVQRGEGYLPEERHRLLWLHHIRPYYKNDIFSLLTRKNTAVSFEEQNYLYWPPLDTENPWEGLADKILTSIWAGPLERRANAVWNMVQEFKIDGIVHFSHWGCRQSCGGASVIGDMLKNKGIPYIILPGDGADPDNYSPGQTRTRLEALIEMLE